MVSPYYNHIELANDIIEMESRIKRSKEGEGYVTKEESDKKPVTPHNTPVPSVFHKAVAKKNIIIQSGNQKSNLLAEGDIEQFKHIDEVVECLTSKVENISRERALDALVFCSFNIERAFDFLSRPEEVYGNMCFNISGQVFSDVDDYVIKYLNSTELYTRLVEEKGQELVEEREKYLKIKK
jgi:hypothetical protein